MTRTLRSEQLRRPWVVWWALLLALWFANAPTLSHALAFASADSRWDICTAQGPRSLAPAADSASPRTGPQDAAANALHCPFCLHPSDHLAPPATPRAQSWAVAEVAQPSEAAPVFFYDGRGLRWRTPRGPPTW